MDRAPAWAQVAIGGLVALRILYHACYLDQDPFALATFSDGRQYEDAALDILRAPPLGTEPFYLQGAYAYFMAACMSLRGGIGLVMLVQLGLAALGLRWFFVAVRRLRGAKMAALALIALLAYPGLAFYENKFLTASLAVTLAIAILRCGTHWISNPRFIWALAMGLALGLAILVRPNMVVAVPLLAMMIVTGAPKRARWAGLAAFGLGLVIAVAPMIWRNVAVTGRATVFPAHGGGTAFYIGNNAHARGVWNDAGGWLTGDVSHEREELRVRLGVAAGDEAREVAEIGSALYKRGFEEIRARPGRWLWLMCRKGWLMLGTDELAQDYDRHGEWELLDYDFRYGLPWGVLVVLAIIGAVGGFWRTPRGPPDETPLRWLLAALAVPVVAANLLYFTSSQHRLPLVVALAVLAPAGLTTARVWIRDRQWFRIGLAVIGIGLTLVPRTHVDRPSSVHYYNLALAWTQLDEPRAALSALDRALELQPDHPIFLTERVALRIRVGDEAGARADLERLFVRLAVQPGPSWIEARARAHAQRLSGRR